jgi:transcriptional regulator GlxA family with amidase domain
MADKLLVGGVLFPGFELLDIFGPMELFGLLPDRIEIVMLGTETGPVASAQGPSAMIDQSWASVDQVDVLIVPGGVGTRALVDDDIFLNHLTRLHKTARFTASICTGAALLARAGLLDGRRATTNKLSFGFPTSLGSKTTWLKRARWVCDDSIYTASGVSAGMDMTLALIEALFDRETALFAAEQAEYVWNQDPDNDPFALE